MQSLSTRTRQVLGSPRDWLHYRRKRFWVLVVLMLYTLGGFFLVPWVAERQLPAIAGDLLERPVSVEGVSFNPFMLSAEIRGVRLEENNGDDLAGFHSLYVNFQLSSLFRRAWTFAEIHLDRPSLDLVRFEDGSVNLLRLIPDRDEPRERSDEGPPRLIIGEFSLNQGRLLYRDETRASRFIVPVSPISFNFTNISTLPEDGGEHRLAAQSEGGANLLWQGTAQWSPLQLAGEITADGPYPALISRYFQNLLNIEVTDGQTRLDLAYQVQQGQNGELNARIDPLQLALRDLTLAEKGGDTVLTLPEADLNGLRLHWPEQTLTVASLSLGGASLELVRGGDGELNVRQWLAAGDDALPSTDPADNGDDNPLGDWTLAVDSTRLHDLSLLFQDAALRKPGSVQIRELNLDLGRITSNPGEHFSVELALALAAGGHIRFTGDATLLPSLMADGQYQIDKLALAGVQPWLSDFARASIDDGHLDMAGTIATSPESALDITGELSLGQLGIAATASDEQLLSWQSLAVDHFAYSLADNHLELSLLTLKQPFARILIDENQNTNIGDLLVERKADAGESTASRTEGTAEPLEPFSLTLGRANIENGSADFADLSLPIPFQTRITDLDGGLDSIDTGSAEPATLELEGQVEEYGQAHIKGSLKPLLPAQQTDIQVVFRNIDIPDLSPYTIKFAGRRIDDGRMDLDLGYQLDNGKLRGRNNVVIHDLKLGEKVDYKGAADLPLGLAVALLKGPDGRIQIDLPVEGDVNNPSFDFGQIIRNAVGNLITRAVTAPFRLLGSLVGGGSDDDFGRLYFAPGSAELSPPERQKVAKLAQALAQRPALGLRIAPVMAPTRDREALKRMITDAGIEATIGGSEDNRQSFTDRRRQALENLFREQFSDDALTAVRNDSRQPEDPEKPDGPQVLDDTRYLSALRARLIEAQEVSDGRLQGLARQRADTLVSLFTGEEGIDRQQARVVAVKTVEATEENRVPLELDVESLE